MNELETIISFLPVAYIQLFFMRSILRTPSSSIYTAQWPWSHVFRTSLLRIWFLLFVFGCRKASAKHREEAFALFMCLILRFLNAPLVFLSAVTSLHHIRIEDLLVPLVIQLVHIRDGASTIAGLLSHR